MPFPKGLADCQAECNISRQTSLAVLNPSTFLGLSLIFSNTSCTSSSVTLEKSVPFGKNSRMGPFVFSTVGFCQGWCGWQK